MEVEPVNININSDDELENDEEVSDALYIILIIMYDNYADETSLIVFVHENFKLIVILLSCLKKQEQLKIYTHLTDWVI